MQAVLLHLSLRLVPDGAGGWNETIVVRGVNVQIINGLGHTASANGVGNLIVGYNELDAQDEHTGSHNLVSGTAHRYTSHGGLVVGFDNAITGAFSSVSGGRINTASGESSAISGGSIGVASGTTSSISGGRAQDAQGEAASVAGGLACRAQGDFSFVAGGLFNSAGGPGATVGGGQFNQCDGAYSTVGGGCNLTASGDCEFMP